ncbi:MAG: VCBS repeat-containing protein [Acidobacteria bacterium]|nr:VCBS repeat-containing protein [Acidobacteriota bacterium]
MRLLLLSSLIVFAAPRPADVPFKKHHLDAGANETAAWADLNGDGRLDIVNGENWYEQPKVRGGEWKKRRFRELAFANNYIDAFSDLPLDVNNDGRIDIISCSWFGKKIAWWENPGKVDAPWKEHIIEDQWNVEFMFLVDLNNDGKAHEILPQFGGKGPTVWYELQGAKWVRHIVDPNNFGHGIGAGDVNGDGRIDVITPKGWLEAPADPRQLPWKMHAEYQAEKHTGFLYATDIDGDGKNDILYPHAHDYGVFWLRQEAGGKWTRSKIDDAWSQVHATYLVDLNGDGQKDLLAGKRFWAHDHDPGAQEPLGIYWYEWRKSGNNVEWIRHIIDYSSAAGAGMQIAVADYDKDGDLDFAVGGKSGAFLFENKTK